MSSSNTVPKRIRDTAAKYPNVTALLSKNSSSEFVPITFQEFYRKVEEIGCGLMALGVKRNEHVGIISDNLKEWIITDLALLGIGAIDVPRGSDSTADEISYILAHADCSVTFAENIDQAKKILSKIDKMPRLEHIILFTENGSDNNQDGAQKTDITSLSDKVKISTYNELETIGQAEYNKETGKFSQELEQGSQDDLATLIYTSGTTGEPKGVMLTHRSFLFQLDRVPNYVNIKPGDILLSVLPVWHSFERAVEYIVFFRGAAIAYSKPVGAVMLPDMAKVRPQWLASVPRIWEGVRAAIYRNIAKEKGVKKALFTFFVATGELHGTMYNLFTGRVPDFSKRSETVDKVLSILPLILLTPLKFLGNVLVFSKIKTKLGGRFIAGISGGGALPPYVDKFFQAAGILLLEGYGLTETGPVLAVRKLDHPVPSTVGPLLPDIDHRIVDKEGLLLPAGKKGTLFVKSEQIMEGYYKRAEATTAVLKEGWLDTGDIAMMTHSGELRILGRTKETIVLMGGENIEPVPIEDKLNSSEAILQCMVVGQDKKFLGALIVTDMEKLEDYANETNISYVEKDELLTNPEIHEYIHREIQSLINTKHGFKHFECIYRFKLLERPFEVGTELTQTMKIKREKVYELYKREINSLFV